MGRTFTFAEAAKLLKRSVRTIHTYVERGYIRREYEGDKVVLCRDDVEQLASEQGLNLPALNNKTLTDIQGRLRTLETQMAVVKKIYGIDVRDPLRPSPDLALGLQRAVECALKEKYFEPEEVNLWISQFLRMDEVTFELFRKAGVPADGWQAVFGLCMHLIEFTADPNKSRDSRAWSQYHLELAECLKHLRSIILVWIESGKGAATTALRRHLGGGKDDLVRRLTSPNSN